jgi:RNA polymerase sigma factor (TIGR02999 family)
LAIVIYITLSLGGPNRSTRVSNRGVLRDWPSLGEDALVQPDADPDALFALFYSELHQLAESNLRKAGELTLGATTLIHEAYLNITGREDLSFVDRARFLAYASRAMRGLTIDYARRRRAAKRGGGLQITLADEESPSAETVRTSEELERLDDALNELAKLEPALAELVDLHFFAGFSFIEIAGLRGVSDRTVQRDWRKARLLLHHALLDES